MFTYNEDGNIVFNGEPYLASSLGSSGEGQRRAKAFAEWLNGCLEKYRSDLHRRTLEEIRRDKIFKNPLNVT